jgi:hypothetical protein
MMKTNNDNKEEVNTGAVLDPKVLADYKLAVRSHSVVLPVPSTDGQKQKAKLNRLEQMPCGEFIDYEGFIPEAVLKNDSGYCRQILRLTSW